MLSPLALSIALIAGVTASAHCVVMCGSVICSFSPTLRRQVGFHAGRVAGYALAGAAAASVGVTLHAVTPSSAQWTARALTSALGILLGLHAAGVVSIFANLERVAKRAFAHVSPVIVSLTHASSSGFRQTVLAPTLGLLWSMVPCAMVYAALALAAVSGSVLAGATTMLAFGIGTTPALLIVGALASRLTGTASQASQQTSGRRVPPAWVGRARIGLGLLVALLSLVQTLSALEQAGWFGAQQHTYWDHAQTCDSPGSRR
jgi:sulfite exporter TauE/SafE